jgi:hypothetical protein
VHSGRRSDNRIINTPFSVRRGNAGSRGDQPDQVSPVIWRYARPSSCLEEDAAGLCADVPDLTLDRPAVPAE